MGQRLTTKEILDNLRKKIPIQTVSLVRGSPGSGKSTLAKGYESNGWVRLNRDERGGKVSSLVQPMVEALASGKNVILDNTFPNRSSRTPFIKAARAKGVLVDCITMSTTLEEAQFNVCQRMIYRYGRLLGPDECKNSKDPSVFSPAAIFSYRKRQEDPDLDEGFNCLWTHIFERRRTQGHNGKAIILDFDGTLRTASDEAQYKYPTKLSEVRIMPDRRQILEKYLKDGYLLLGASNQSGIHKRIIDEDKAAACCRETINRLGLDVDCIYCPHRTGLITCWCRKPMPGIGVFVIEKYKLDPSKCIMVGDQTTDKIFAERSGFQYLDQKEFFQCQ